MKNMAKMEKKDKGRKCWKEKKKKRKRIKSKIRFIRRDRRENYKNSWPEEKDWEIEKLVGSEKIPNKNKKDKINFKQGSLSKRENMVKVFYYGK